MRRWILIVRYFLCTSCIQVKHSIFDTAVEVDYVGITDEKFNEEFEMDSNSEIRSYVVT